MRFISFFAGIGGFDLGLERAGHTCVAQVEIDEFCRKILTKHWPNVPKYGDINELNGNELPEAELWCGGFPCQDISVAGKAAGIHGKRSGLFFSFSSLIRKVRPKHVILENVSALLYRGMGELLGEFSSIGYDAEWDCISAFEFGAPHKRGRIFIHAYPAGGGWNIFENQTADIPKKERLSYFEQSGYRWWCKNGRHSMERVAWSVEPEIRGSDDGIPAESHAARLRALGNAVCPPVAEYIGKLLIK